MACVVILSTQLLCLFSPTIGIKIMTCTACRMHHRVSLSTIYGCTLHVCVGVVANRVPLCPRPIFTLRPPFIRIGGSRDLWYQAFPFFSVQHWKAGSGLGTRLAWPVDRDLAYATNYRPPNVYSHHTHNFSPVARSYEDGTCTRWKSVITDLSSEFNLS